MGAIYQQPYGQNFPPQKPEKIKLAIQLLYIGLAIGAFHGLLYLFQMRRVEEVIIALVILSVSLGINWVLIFFISKGNNVARIIFTVLAGISSLLLLPAIIYSPILDALFFIGTIGLNIYIIILLYDRTSSNWFNRFPNNYQNFYPHY